MTDEDFIGREVDVIVDDSGRHEVDVDDPVMEELEGTYSDLRIWLPGRAGTPDYVGTRTNVLIEKDEEGIWRITRIFKG